ncbi:Bacterial Fmu (Sun)/eukaryotic nucleolar NOL1/Nop2p [Neofusicoccum parvum]|uniref:Bacterial Fmu (Sun)/eukaryotic nucleolar NOL1/Nop2p n=1 Tax=Neofusicoccum parvum TaxID=310453 RepID=A0ACB5S0J8_9PEZI|nr:Bacterial Fmu (Sun)/eukaryotic nucleolar NOL1/Nop2p [Neofusicoccum parvum]
MGKRGGRGGGRGRGRGNRGGHGGSSRGDWKEVEKHNVNFEKYYNELAIVPEEEREQFWTALKKELPNSFRFTGSKGHALAVQQRLVEHYIPEISKVTFDGQLVEPPTQLEWFPEKLAWQMTTAKNVIRKFPPFASFQKFLVSETTVGNISRQEVVSMIPPLLIDIKPWHTVLDLCAAPGSKSAQLCEAIHNGEEARLRKNLRKIAPELGREISPDGAEVEAEKDQAGEQEDYSDDGRATGLLICNDVDNRRAHMLVHQVKRLNSPNLVVTNHDATLFPSIRIPSEKGQPNKYLKFDRILADVPCSGDGTARKNPGVWKDWTAGNGLGLYITQQRILVRALQMLKVGGRVVYSTCSLNPIENEAVVASAIDRCGGMSKVKIIDCSQELPGLKRVPGLNTWKVMDKAGRMWNSWEDVVAKKSEPGEEGLNKILEGMFPPKATENEDEKVPLERCIRVYPHHQNTGGFFITVIEKKEEIRARPEYQANASGSKAVPPAPITNLINEIEQKTENGEKLEGLKSLDEVTNTDSKAEVDPVQGNDPAAVRSNLPPPSPTKRSLEDTEAEDPVAKRTKIEVIQHDEVPPAVSEREHRGPPEKKRRDQPHEEPFKYLDPKHEVLEDIFGFYEIASRFPRDRFMVRNASGEPAKAVYYTSTLAREILTMNEGKGMKFVHCGVKMFMKQDAQGQDICRWRIQSEGLPIIEPWVGENRIVRLYKRSTLHKLLIEMFPKVAGNSWKDLGEIGERVRDIGMGCCVLRVETSDDEDGFKAMLLRLYNDNSELIDHSKTYNKSNGANGESAPKDAPEASALDNGDGGVALDAGMDIDAKDTTTGADPEVEAIVAEDRLDSAKQDEKDNTRETAEGDVVAPEDDVVNTTV